MQKIAEQPERLGWRDYFQIFSTGIMGTLAVYILWKTFFVKWAFPSLIFGIVLLLYSFFRVRLIWDYFQKKGRSHVIGNPHEL